MLPPHHTFSHEAMATTFSVFVAGVPAEYARQAAAAAFRELDRLENELSRYVESSDIARANRLAEGESLILGEDALRCLLLASRLSAATDRAFDPAYASLAPGRPFADQALYALDPARHELTSLTPRLHLDLGAVGKGYALDCMADLLREWTLTEVCLQSGGSTALALAPPAGLAGWPVGLGEGDSYRSLMLRDRALSGSGVAVQGAHVIDVRRGQPAQRQTANLGVCRGRSLFGCALHGVFCHDRRRRGGLLPATPRVWSRGDGGGRHGAASRSDRPSRHPPSTPEASTRPASACEKQTVRVHRGAARLTTPNPAGSPAFPRSPA
jgi:thiamine biosynthesis lipoprotein